MISWEWAETTDTIIVNRSHEDSGLPIEYRCISFSDPINHLRPFSIVEYDVGIVIANNSVLELRQGDAYEIITPSKMPVLIAVRKTKGKDDILSFQVSMPIHLSRLWLKSAAGGYYSLGNSVLLPTDQWYISQDTQYSLCTDNYGSCINMRIE